jgi:DNA-binding PadR family transcriptional regulator
MAADPREYLPLTPAMFHVLLAIAGGPMHGYNILKDVAERTAGEVQLSTGTLYGLIKRLLDEELIVETPTPPGEDERRRCYRLAPLGRLVAEAEAGRLDRLLTDARRRNLLGGVSPVGES